jgi:hypothetical protein
MTYEHCFRRFYSYEAEPLDFHFAGKSIPTGTAHAHLRLRRLVGQSPFGMSTLTSLAAVYTWEEFSLDCKVDEMVCWSRFYIELGDQPFKQGVVPPFVGAFVDPYPPALLRKEPVLLRVPKWRPAEDWASILGAFLVAMHGTTDPEQWPSRGLDDAPQLDSDVHIQMIPCHYFGSDDSLFSDDFHANFATSMAPQVDDYNLWGKDRADLMVVTALSLRGLFSQCVTTSEVE